MKPFSPMLVYGLWNFNLHPQTLTHALISSYCSGFLFEVPSEDLDRVQHLQNSAARVLTHAKPWQHIAHHLPVKAIISSSLKKPSMVLPHTIYETFTPHLPHPRILQFSEQFSTPPAKDCKPAFSVAAPTIRNSLCSKFCNIGHFHRVNQNVLICCIITIIKHINHLRDKLLVSQKYYQGVRKQFLLLFSSVLGSNIELSLSVFLTWLWTFLCHPKILVGLRR